MEKTNGLSKTLTYFLKDKRAQNLSPNSIHWYEEKLKVFESFCKEYKVHEVEDITPVFIREYLLYLKEKGHNEGGVHGYYRALKAFLIFFENEFEPEDFKNPIKKVKAPKVSVEPIEGISLEVFHKLVDLCDKKTFTGVRDKTILLVLLETGVRASELLNMNIEDVDFSDSSILVRMGKGRKPRTVFMGQSVRRQIRKYSRYLPETGALFVSSQGNRLAYGGLRQVVRRLCNRAGVPEVGIHDFRRTFALQSLRRGVDLVTLSRLMGHTSLQVLSRYLKQTTGDLGVSFRSIIDN